jgi:uncharacterized protein YgbK (DUF1537 family)
MSKTLIITIQIEKMDLQDIAKLEEDMQQALKDYKHKRVGYNIVDDLIPPIPTS